MNITNNNSDLLWLVLLLACLGLAAPEAFAGTGDTTFNNVVTQLTNWATGGLGRVIALSAVIVGAIVSVVRSNPLPILSGIAFAMILNFTPQIVTGILTATI